MSTALVRYGHSRQGVVVLKVWAIRREKYGDHGSPCHHNRRKTHCRHGHKFTAANTLVRRHGWRQCRACSAISRGAFSRRRLLRQRLDAARRKLMCVHPDRTGTRRGWQSAYDEFVRARRKHDAEISHRPYGRATRSD